MRRGLLLAGVVALAVAAMTTLALALPPLLPSPVAATGDPHITRLFIPAIKDDCRVRAGIADAEARLIGYTFTADGALVTIDQDGSLTGIHPDLLETFNACMALYPVEPIQEIPRDHYTRNLLYDYITGILQPCLADRFTNLPEMPTRADFVERLYAWDPYRMLAPRLNLQELMELSVACPELPPYLVAD
jgi:hypothetical protein